MEDRQRYIYTCVHHMMAGRSQEAFAMVDVTITDEEYNIAYTIAKTRCLKVMSDNITGVDPSMGEINGYEDDW